MQPTKMRPTFTVDLPVPADEAAQRIRQGLETGDPPGSSDALGRCAELFVDRSQRRLWSPHLSVQVEETQSGALLRGRFSPRPEIWTFVMLLYFTTGTLTFFGAMLGYAQWIIGQTPWGLYVVPIGLLLIGLLHIVSLVGQLRARDQMQQLQDRLDAVLTEAFRDV